MRSPPLLLLPLLLLLAACSDGYMTPKAYEMAVVWCEPHGGLRLAKMGLLSSSAWELDAHCVDRTVVSKRIPGQP